MSHLLRSAAFLALVTSGITAQAGYEPRFDELDGEEAVQNAPPAAESDGKAVFSVPILSQRWEGQAVLNVTRDKVAFVTSDEDVVVVQSTSGTVTVFNSESGRELWSEKVGQTDEVAMKATTDSQIVAIVSGPVIHAFDKFSGRKLFAFRLPTNAAAEPLITRREFTIGNSVKIVRSIFVALGDKSIVAYDLETLRYLGQHGTLKKGVARPLDWRFAGGEMTLSAPVAGQERLAVATDRGNVIAVKMSNLDKGKTQFQFFMESRATAPLTLVTRDDREYLLVACENKRLYCIDMKSAGVLLWTFPLPRPITKPIVCIGEEVFAVTSEGEMHKIDLKKGLPIKVSDGSQAVVARSEGGIGELPAYGAAVIVGADGRLLLEPISVSNNSTGQVITSLQINLGTCPSRLKFAVDESGMPLIRLAGDNGLEAGYRKAEVSEDRLSLTLTFSNFNPNEEFHFHAEFEHSELEMKDITDAHLANADIRATVTPVRASVASTASLQPLSPQKIMGRMKPVNHPWKVTGTAEVLAISDSAVFFADPVNNVVSVSRLSGKNRLEKPLQDYTIHVSNSLTDRVFVATTTGRVACLTESRIELSVMPIPLSGALVWVPYPKSELSPPFARFHQNPERQPVLPLVPESDPPSETDEQSQ